VHTNVSNLRHVLGRAAGPRRIGYVIKVGGRYRLDPATVEVDLREYQGLVNQLHEKPWTFLEVGAVAGVMGTLLVVCLALWVWSQLH
jgi:two-component SAPR family response regulator